MIDFQNDDESKTVNLIDSFQEDFLSIERAFKEKLENQDLILVGAAGSIGFAMVPLILSASPRNLLLLDQDENRLTMLLRLIRAKNWVNPLTNLTLAAMDFGSIEAKQLLRTFSSNPIVLNFAASKHVRSERDIFGITHLLMENFIKPWQLIEDLNPKYYFGVSTDKAANPVNFMGATKALHEQLLFSINSSSARFANVAFSQGSLLDSWRYRLRWKEPLVAPKEVSRYLITHADAANLCAISIAKCGDAGVLVPNVGVIKSFFLEEILMKYLMRNNLKPMVFENYYEAQQFLISVKRKENEWPIVLTTPDTSGEKLFEEFVGNGEKLSPVTNLTSQITPSKSTREQLEKIREYVLQELIYNQENNIEMVQDLICEAIPSFKHSQSNESLDGRP
jgi:FlaA1/EpsC-like NDP-sugar epimerase